MSTVLARRQPHEHVSHSRRRVRVQVAPAPALSPVSIVDIPEPGTGEGVLTQQWLKGFYELEQIKREVDARYSAKLAKLKEAILHGADVKLGTFKTKPTTHLARHPRYKQALIDAKGEEYQLRVLEKTAPHVHFRVTVE